LNSDENSWTPGRWLRVLVSYGIAAGCLYWVFHDLNVHEMVVSLERVRWAWLVPSVLLDLLVYVCAGWEWQILLRPVGHLSVLRTTQAVFAGRFANDVLPFHIGYVLRVYLVSRWLDKRLALIVPSLLLERLFDSFWLALGIGSMAAFVQLPGEVAGMVKLWIAIVGFGIVVLAAMLLSKGKRAPASRAGLFRWKWARKVRDIAGELIGEIRTVGRSWVLPAGFAVSFLKFAAQGLAFLLILWAYGLYLPIWTQLAVFMIAYVGISVPSTPASVGVFQVFCVSGLRLFGIAKPTAVGFSILAFLVLTLPLTVAGFIAFGQSGVSMGQVKKGLSG
jgi:uncharacterized protein (TIRG00374 family)